LPIQGCHGSDRDCPGNCPISLQYCYFSTPLITSLNIPFCQFKAVTDASVTEDGKYLQALIKIRAIFEYVIIC